MPSKAPLSSAKRAAAVRNAGGYGVRMPGGSEVDFPAVMERMRELRAETGPNDSAERFRGLGIDVFLGEGHFKDEASGLIVAYGWFGFGFLTRLIVWGV